MKRAAVPSVLVGVLLLALGVIADVAAARKVSRIGFLSNRLKPTPSNPDLFENAFRQGLGISVILRGKTSLSSIAMLKEWRNVF